MKDLQLLWEGVELKVPFLNCSKIIRCALMCVSCDLPAGRKLCGFLGHGAHLGCSKCLKKFTGSVGTMDYSGFDREKWKKRGVEHKKFALEINQKNTRAKREREESEKGCHYSALLDLPYFDAPRMLVMDPMHNLFLGSAKHFMKAIFIGCGIIADDKFDTIQQCIDSFILPPDVGRIPHKIRSGFSSFSADQWKNWTVYFSVIALRDILDDDTLECW